MLQNFFYLLLLFFAFVYFMRAVLLAGYMNIHVKKSNLLRDLIQSLITIKPLLQRTLPVRNLEFKIYSRFLRKSEIYYFTLWATLIVILFLTSHLYLNIF